MLELQAQKQRESWRPDHVHHHGLQSHVRLVDPHRTGAAILDNATLVEVLDGGSGGVLDDLDSAGIGRYGGSATVRYVARAGDGERVVAHPATATADQWLEPVSTPAWTTFVGSGLPIWAIQGPEIASPYVHSVATVDGVVTGVFPELEGFWVQSLEPDGISATSEGLYIYAPGLVVTATLGDRVQVTGKVREKSGETLLYLQDLDDLRVVGVDLPLPAAVELDPPQDSTESAIYYEALEGMLVSVTEPAVAVGPTTVVWRVRPGALSMGTVVMMQGEPRGMLILWMMARRDAP